MRAIATNWRYYALLALAAVAAVSLSVDTDNMALAAVLMLSFVTSAAAFGYLLIRWEAADLLPEISKILGGE